MSKVNAWTARNKLRAVEMTIRRTNYGEWRVNFRNGIEATAYYTNDLDDALTIGLLMSKSKEDEDEQQLEAWREANGIQY